MDKRRWGQGFAIAAAVVAGAVIVVLAGWAVWALALNVFWDSVDL